MLPEDAGPLPDFGDAAVPVVGSADRELEIVLGKRNRWSKSGGRQDRGAQRLRRKPHELTSFACSRAILDARGAAVKRLRTARRDRMQKLLCIYISRERRGVL
jgi:hypothetical protein